MCSVFLIRPSLCYSFSLLFFSVSVLTSYIHILGLVSFSVFFPRLQSIFLLSVLYDFSLCGANKVDVWVLEDRWPREVLAHMWGISPLSSRGKCSPPLGRIRMLASTARGRKTISKIDKQLKAQVKYWDNIGSVDWHQCHQLTRSADIFSLIHPATHPFSTFEYRVSFHEQFPHDLLVARFSCSATGCVTRATNPRLRLASS